MKITIAGTWAWLWGAWHVLWLGALVWAALLTGWLDLGPEALRAYIAALYTAFLPLEIVGFRDLLDDPPGREVAKTLSQWRQALAGFARDGSPWWLGWKAAAVLSAAIDGFWMGYLTWPTSRLLAVAVGIGITLWLAPHFAARENVG